MQKITDKKALIIDLVIGIILGIVIFLIPLKFVEAIPGSAVTRPTDVTGNILSSAAKSQVALLGLVAIIASLGMLIKNRRLGLTISGWVFLLSLLGFLILNKDSQYLVLSYQTFRNVGYLYLVLYLIVHLAVHSIAWFIKRKRSILTIWGVINWHLVFFLITDAYALAGYK